MSSKVSISFGLEPVPQRDNEAAKQRDLNIALRLSGCDASVDILNDQPRNDVHCSPAGLLRAEVKYTQYGKLPEKEKATQLLVQKVMMFPF